MASLETPSRKNLSLRSEREERRQERDATDRDHRGHDREEQDRGSEPQDTREEEQRANERVAPDFGMVLRHHDAAGNRWAVQQIHLSCL